MANESAAERTESATPRRRSKEREKGNISKSRDMSSAFVVTIGVVLLSVFSAPICTSIQEIVRYAFTHIHPDEISTDDVLAILIPYAQTAGAIMIPFMVFLLIAAVLIIRLEIGHVFAPERAKFDLENISPRRILNNAKKLFNPFEPRVMVEFAKSILKLVIVTVCGAATLMGDLDAVYGILGQPLLDSFGVIGGIMFKMLINMCIAMIVLGLLDKKYQDYEYEKSIKMTKQEVKDELKDIEGDPKIKSRIRSQQMQMAKQRMMAQVPKADVVVTNPTHYAVALVYDRTKAPAPMVVAKGVDYVAFQIREIAKQHGVPIVENRPVARALYNSVPIDGIIPSDLYVAVSEILAYVYSRRKGNK